jgi:pimeloyl-ACP methyl ester carboxylesterase
MLASLAVLVVLVAAALALARPFEPKGLLPNPDPARDYADALARCTRLVELDGALVNPQCASRFLVHGGRTPRAVVLFHGLANCPLQFSRIADSLYAQGCNVLLPRAPYHGYTDRLTREQARLRAIDLARATDEAVDIAHGLGDTVIVAGLSTGGLQAAWAAQFRPDVARAALICPVFGVGPVPAPLTAAFVRAAATLPDTYLWWDPRARERVPGPRQVYPGYFTRELGQVLRFGLVVQAAARRTRPAARELAVVTSGSDLAVNNTLTAEVVRNWRDRGAVVDTHEFPRALNVGHDVVDPEQPYARPEITCPVLVKAILGR